MDSGRHRNKGADVTEIGASVGTAAAPSAGAANCGAPRLVLVSMLTAINDRAVNIRFSMSLSRMGRSARGATTSHLCVVNHPYFYEGNRMLSLDSYKITPSSRNRMPHGNSGRKCVCADRIIQGSRGGVR